MVCGDSAGVRISMTPTMMAANRVKEKASSRLAGIVGYSIASEGHVAKRTPKFGGLGSQSGGVPTAF
jgi:hypothetical protein